MFLISFVLFVWGCGRSVLLQGGGRPQHNTSKARRLMRIGARRRPLAKRVQAGHSGTVQWRAASLAWTGSSRQRCACLPASHPPRPHAPNPAHLAVPRQAAIGRHLSHPQRRVVPGHVGVVPTHIGQPTGGAEVKEIVYAGRRRQVKGPRNLFVATRCSTPGVSGWRAQQVQCWQISRDGGRKGAQGAGRAGPQGSCLGIQSAGGAPGAVWAEARSCVEVGALDKRGDGTSRQICDQAG
jgi:hypothetical protein